MLPAYRESPSLLERMAAYLPPQEQVLVVLVLNRPSIEPDGTANQPLRGAIHALKPYAETEHLFDFGNHALYCLDLEDQLGPTPADMGVGLARKHGCDLALAWQLAGSIDSPWIAQTDADATLPADYFSRLNQAAGTAQTFPFFHRPGGDKAIDVATRLYELKLHDYVLQRNKEFF